MKKITRLIGALALLALGIGIAEVVMLRKVSSPSFVLIGSARVGIGAALLCGFLAGRASCGRSAKDRNGETEHIGAP